MTRFWELNESGEIAIAIGIILAKRKGGIHENRYPSLFSGEYNSNNYSRRFLLDLHKVDYLAALKQLMLTLKVKLIILNVS